MVDVIPFLKRIACVVTWGVLLPFLVAEEEDTPLPPDVAELTIKYAKAMARAAEPITSLKESYADKLKELQEMTQARGDLESTVLIANELERIDERAPGRNSDLTELEQLQSIYHRHAERVSPRVNLEKARLEKAYHEKLSEFIGRYTQDGDLKTALRLQKVLEKSSDRLATWNRLAAGRAAENDPFAYLNWDKLDELIQQNKLGETARVGGNPQSNATTRDVPEDPSVLVGFDLHMGPFGDSDDTVRKLVPLFRSEHDRLFEGKPRANAKGQQRRRVLARDGYAVSGITTHSEAGVRKVKFTFSRVDGLRLDPLDTYESPFYGEWEGGRIATLDTEGKLPVGIDGWVGLGTGEFWLVVAETD